MESIHCLTEEVYLSQIDDFIAVSAKNCFEHEEAEARHLIAAPRAKSRNEVKAAARAEPPNS